MQRSHESYSSRRSYLLSQIPRCLLWGSFNIVGSNSSKLASACLSWVVRATCGPDARSAQEAIVLFGYGTETLPVAFGDPGNK